MDIGDDMSSFKWSVIKGGDASTLEENLNMKNKERLVDFEGTV